MKGSPLRNAIEDSVSARQCSFSERLEWTRGLSATGTVLVSDKDPVSTACPLLEPRTVPVFITVPRLLRPLDQVTKGKESRAAHKSSVF